jgi:sporulation protein YlmC with PRC-barrel domain
MKISTMTLASILTLASVGYAGAQSAPSPAPSPPSSPAAPAPDVKPSAGGDRAKAGDATFIPAQKNDEILASEWVGMAVKNDAGEALGTIKDVAVDKQGKITAVMIGVGGFLGLGETYVAVPYDAVRLAEKDGKHTASASLNKQQLETAPRYVTLKAKKAEEDSKANRPAPSSTPPGSRPATTPK